MQKKQKIVVILLVLSGAFGALQWYSFVNHNDELAAKAKYKFVVMTPEDFRSRGLPGFVSPNLVRPSPSPTPTPAPTEMAKLQTKTLQPVPRTNIQDTLISVSPREIFTPPRAQEPHFETGSSIMYIRNRNYLLRFAMVPTFTEEMAQELIRADRRGRVTVHENTLESCYHCISLPQELKKALIPFGDSSVFYLNRVPQKEDPGCEGSATVSLRVSDKIEGPCTIGILREAEAFADSISSQSYHVYVTSKPSRSRGN
jgi:hypothetical protein